MKRVHTVLVTGASAGIGETFAEEYARTGCNLVVTARRSERLDALSQRLQARYGVHCLTIVADLAQPEAPQKLFDEITEAGLTVDVLINNAGYGVAGDYPDASWGVHRDFIQVMCTAVAHLTHLCLPQMLSQGYGRVINVSSVAALLPGAAGHTLYAASKAFVVKFSESLSLETMGKGINITAACPGFTYSEFHDVIGVRAEMDSLPKFLWLTPTEVARQSMKAVEKGQVLCVNGGIYRAIVALVKLMPYRVTRWLMQRLKRA